MCLLGVFRLGKDMDMTGGTLERLVAGRAISIETEVRFNPISIRFQSDLNPISIWSQSDLNLTSA